MDTDRHAGRNYFMKTPTTTIIKSLLILSRDIQSDDGVANAALREAAERMQDMFEMLKRRSSEESVEAELLKSVEPAQQ